MLVLASCGTVSWLIYSVVAWLSRRFAYGTPGVERPILEVLGLLAAAFAIYLVALRAAVRAGDRREVLPTIVIFAVSMRLLLLFSVPVQEVDVYRYLWDGQATIHGVSPYRYSPDDVLKSSSDQMPPADLSRLVEVKDSTPALKLILGRVHFAGLPTVYPPVSQAVFALAAWMTPSNADVSTHLAVIKAWIVAFDLATIWPLILILRLARKPIGWSLAYAWCPLVLKEFANSGHLDSIAVCLTTLAVYGILRASCQLLDAMTAAARSGRASSAWATASSLTLGLAVGAKLYPVVLAPLLICVSVRRLGRLRATFVTILFLVVSGVACAPMLKLPVRGPVSPENAGPPASLSDPSLPPLPPGASEFDAIAADSHDPGEGLKAFLSRWQMNDFLFSLVIENLTPMTGAPSEQRPWFAVTPENWRLGLAKRVAEALSVAREQVPFVLARTATAAVFLMLACWWCWRAVGTCEAARLAEAVFLTLAWFWLLLPTQNPWYWIWAVPFLPFARNRAWLVLSGLSLLYYLRFWFRYHWPNEPVLFTNYSGEQFFDFVVTWIEFGPWLMWLAVSALLNRRDQATGLRRHDEPGARSGQSWRFWVRT